MKISLIAAVAENSAIGCKNQLLCHLPNDLKHFKELTTGHNIVMGRKTFESLPNGALPNRNNIILSRTYSSEKIRKKPNVEAQICNSINVLLDQLYQLTKDSLFPDEEIFIIGGESIYRQMIGMANKLYLTKIHAAFPEADVFFPEINYREWREVSRKIHPADDKHPYSFSFIEYERVV